jgi:hypothetical protein
MGGGIPDSSRGALVRHGGEQTTSIGTPPLWAYARALLTSIPMIGYSAGVDDRTAVWVCPLGDRGSSPPLHERKATPCAHESSVSVGEESCWRSSW